MLSHLNTPTPGAFNEAADPGAHGSWLHVAKVELSALSRQGLWRRRICDLDTLQREIAA